MGNADFQLCQLELFCADVSHLIFYAHIFYAWLCCGLLIDDIDAFLTGNEGKLVYILCIEHLE